MPERSTPKTLVAGSDAHTVGFDDATPVRPRSTPDEPTLVLANRPGTPGEVPADLAQNPTAEAPTAVLGNSRSPSDLRTSGLRSPDPMVDASTQVLRDRRRPAPGHRSPAPSPEERTQVVGDHRPPTHQPHPGQRSRALGSEEPTQVLPSRADSPNSRRPAPTSQSAQASMSAVTQVLGAAAPIPVTRVETEAGLTDALAPKPPRTTLETAAGLTDAFAVDPPRTKIETAAGLGDAFGVDPPRKPSASDTGTFYRLPAALADRYELIEEVGSGGQGVVLRCHDEIAGHDVAIKLLNRGVTGHPSTLVDQLRDCDAAHVTPILDFDPAGRWEVQEFFPLGTLAQIRRDYWTPERTRSFLEQLHAALTHVHSRQILHQDLKPANIFVRSLEPLDVVLGDFGLARQQEITEQVSSRDGTLAYQSPEYALAGRHSAGGDWWALGMILHILLTGRHVYADDRGRIDSRALRAHLFDGDLALGHVADPRWRILLEGLLTRELRDRWGAGEVSRWLDGDTPAVRRGESPQSRAARTRSITLLQRVCTTPEEVAAALGADSVAALTYLRSPAADDLRDWLRRIGLADDADEFIAPIRSGTGSDERHLVALQAVLDPDTSPRFGGRQLSMTELFAVADQAAEGDDTAGAWIARLRHARALSGAAQVETHAAAAMADERLRMWWIELDARTARLPDVARELAVRQRAALEGLALGAALSDTRRATLLKSGATALRRGSVLPEHFRQAVEPHGRDDVVAALLASVVVPELVRRHKSELAAEEQVRAQVATLGRDAERKRIAAERKAMRSHRRADNLARLRSRLGWHGSAALVATAAVGFLGRHGLPATAATMAAGYAITVTALFLLDAITGQGRARLPRLLGLPAALATTAWVATLGPGGTASITPELALAPPAGYLAGYAVGSLGGWILDRIPAPAGRVRVARGLALIGLVPAATAIGWVLERATWLGRDVPLPEGYLAAAETVARHLPSFDLPDPLAVWWGLPVLICLWWGLDAPSWVKLGPARPWLAGISALLAAISFIADPLRFAVGLFYGAPLLLVLLVVLATWRPRPLLPPPPPPLLGPPPLA